MYIWYTVTKSSGVMFEIVPEAYPYKQYEAAASNCELMVPGTVDPTED